CPGHRKILVEQAKSSQVELLVDAVELDGLLQGLRQFVVELDEQLAFLDPACRVVVPSGPPLAAVFWDFQSQRMPFAKIVQGLGELALSPQELAKVAVCLGKVRRQRNRAKI